ncbi:MAG: DUF6470 family protein [Thermacetogeniaceae bacterium]|jgi:hypothetical protein
MKEAASAELLLIAEVDIEVAGLRIEIDQVFGKLGLVQTIPFLRLEHTYPQIKLRIDDPVLTVKLDQVELSIDYEECWADLNMYKPLEFSRVNAYQAREKTQKEIAQIASEGDRLAALESGEVDAMAAIAREKGMEQVDFELAHLSLPQIKAQVIEGEKFFQKGNVQLEHTPGDVRLKLQKGSVRMYLSRYPELHIRTIGEHLNIIA